MNKGRTNWALVAGCAVLVGVILVVCLALLWWGLTAVWSSRVGPTTRYPSNGAQIYFTATSQRGTAITSDLRMGMMGGARFACVSCHRADGRGARVRLMMHVFESPDIRYKALTADEHGEGDEHEHEPWTDEAIKLAITEGVEPDGQALAWPMPRWTMSEADLDDLLVFLKTLD